MSASPEAARVSSSSESSTSSHCSRCSCRSSAAPESTSVAEPSTQHPASQQQMHAFLTRADLAMSLEAHDALLAAAKEYRLACMSKAAAGAAFAAALDGCSRVKGADSAGPGLQAAAGFHYVLSQSERVVADRLYKTFEIPLLETRDAYHDASADRSTAYASALTSRTKKIRETEQSHLRPPLSRAPSSRKGGAAQGAGAGGGGRDLGMLKETLRVLQEQVEELERVKGEYYTEVLDAEQTLWSTILSRTGTVLKAQLSSIVTLSAKADDRVIAQVLADAADPFQTDVDDGKSKDAGNILTALPPLSSSAGTSTPASPSAPSTPKPSASLLPQEDRTESLFGEADNALDEEVEALLSPRGSRRPSISMPHPVMHEDATPRKAVPTASTSSTPETRLSDSPSSSSSSSSGNDTNDDSGTISPTFFQQRKEIPFPLLNASVSADGGPTSQDEVGPSNAAVQLAA